jgi:hypothetical protein
MKLKPLHPVLLLAQLTLLALGWLGVATAAPSELARHVMLGVISLGITRLGVLVAHRDRTGGNICLWRSDCRCEALD